MADNKSKTTTEVLDREDDLQIEDNFESPLEELDELGPTQRRRISSSSSTKSKEETRKRTKLGSVEENEENTSDSDEEWSEEEFTVSFRNAPVWARGMMSFLRSSINSLKQSTNAFKVEMQCIKEDIIHFRNDNDHRMESLEKSVSYVSDKFENWRDEKAVLLSQIAEMETEYELKFDDIEQYSRRSCLILTGIKERKGENTDNLVLNALSTHRGITLDLYETDRLYRLGRKRIDQDGHQIDRPIIIKFIGYRSRQKVFKQKRKLKGTGISLFENLTKRRTMLMNDVKKIAGLKNVWSMDGNIFTFDHIGKILHVQTFEDLSKVRKMEATPVFQSKGD